MSPASYAILADLVVILHLVFVVFAALGGLLVLRFRWIAWLHVPAFIWAGIIEITGGICPLTPLENWLRYLGGESMYVGSFLGHYAWQLLYPAELTRELQIALGVGLLVLNLVVYATLIAKLRRR